MVEVRTSNNRAARREVGLHARDDESVMVLGRSGAGGHDDRLFPTPRKTHPPPPPPPPAPPPPPPPPAGGGSRASATRYGAEYTRREVSPFIDDRVNKIATSSRPSSSSS